MASITQPPLASALALPGTQGSSNYLLSLAPHTLFEILALHVLFCLPGNTLSLLFIRVTASSPLFLIFLGGGLCCCTQAFSSCGERGLLFVAVHGLLVTVASLVAEHEL